MFHAQGDRGRLLVVYAEAATLGAWRCSTGDTLGAVTHFDAAIQRAHEWRLRQRPLVIALPFGAYEWRWTLRDEDLHLHDGRLRATAIGAPVVFPRVG